MSDSPLIAWGSPREGAIWGTGADGRVFVVDQAGGKWRWTLADQSHQSGAHANADDAKAHAENYERDTRALFEDTTRFLDGTEDETMAKGKKSKGTSKRAAEREHNGTNGTAPPGLPSGAIKKHEFHEQLPVPLDEAERTDRSRKLADLTCERVGAEEELAGVKERVKGLKKREDSMAEELRKNAEQRDVLCAEYLLPTNEMQKIRTDTGEVLETRPATADELQEPMFDGDEEREDDEDVGDQPGAEG